MNERILHNQITSDEATKTKIRRKECASKIPANCVHIKMALILVPMCEYARHTRPKAAQSHNIKCRKPLVGVSLLCAYINNIRYVHILKQCGCERVRLDLFTWMEWNRRSHVLRQKQLIEHVSMWAGIQCFHLENALCCCYWAIVTLGYISLFLCVSNVRCEYVSAWVTAFFPSLCDASNVCMVVFFSVSLSVLCISIIFTDTFFYVDWQLNGSFFFSLLSHLCSAMLQWRVNVCMGDSFFPGVFFPTLTRYECIH